MLSWRPWRAILVLLALSSSVPSAALGDDGFIVIVNRKNPVLSLSVEGVAQIFLKRVVSWDDGSEILPVDIRSPSAVRNHFTRQIHGKRVPAIKGYWQKQIFTGRGVPPPEKRSDDDVVAFVKSKRGAIGYVSGRAQLDGVKIVKIER